jgi:hypothetical protein
MTKPTSRARLADTALPFSDYPTCAFPASYYKTVHKAAHQHYVLRVGLLLHLMRRSEEDHLLHLLQVFNRDCPRVRLHIVLPNTLFA